MQLDNSPEFSSILLIPLEGLNTVSQICYKIFKRRQRLVEILVQTLNELNLQFINLTVDRSFADGIEILRRMW